MTRTHLTALAAGALCATALAAAPAAPARAPIHAGKLQRDLRQLTRAGAPGAVVLVRRGTRTRRFARGLADRATRARMRPADRFRIGSVTKTFTATAVLQLVAEGRLSLDDTVEHWLGDVVPGSERITVRQLLNHTSGVFNYTDDPEFFEDILRDPLQRWTPPALVAIAVEHGATFPPGTSWAYSNTGYVLLGMIAEAAAGRPLADQLEARIFRPLRLRHTRFATRPHIKGRHAHGYFAGRDVSAFSPTIAWGAGAIISTADDVARFYRALMAGRLLAPEQMREMKTTVPVGVPGAAFGLGIARMQLECGRAWGHDGDFPGYLTTARISADGRREAVVMVNSDTLSDEARRALDRLITTAYCG